MRLPNGMTEREVMKIMSEVVETIAPKYKFGYLTDEDLKQESFIICIDALERYDGRAPLANFLSVNLKNRLHNFKRDNYFRYNPNCDADCTCRFCKQKADKKNLLNPLDIFEYADNFTLDEDESKEIQDLIDKIDIELSAEYREDYLKLKNGIKIPKKRRLKIIEQLESIIYDNR